MPSSTLQRLFKFAKAQGAEALENFTTEALAAAIREDPRPLLAALRLVPDVPVRDDDHLEHVDTQVPVEGGTVDLIVKFGHSAYWFEVKAHAGLHGSQLETYRRAMADDRTGVHATLLLLAKRPLTPEVPTLRWNYLRNVVVGEQHPYWRDLRRFLEERGMADEYDEPIEVRELAALAPARTLLRKVDRIAETFIESFEPPSGADPEFPTSRPRRRGELAQQFRRHGRMVVSSRRYPSICFGVTLEGGRPCLSLWIETRTRDFAARKVIFDLAREHGLDRTWTLADGRYGYLGASRELESGIDHDSAVAWLHERTRELAAGRILEALPRFRGGATAEETEEPEDADDS